MLFPPTRLLALLPLLSLRSLIIARDDRFSLLGIVVSGDVDGVTIYTDRYGRKTWFPRSPPLEPASPIQQLQRDRWSQAAKLYQMLTPDQKQKLSACCRKLSLLMNGPSLFTALYCQPTDTVRQTLIRQSRIDLPNPQTIPQR